MTGAISVLCSSSELTDYIVEDPEDFETSTFRLKGECSASELWVQFCFVSFGFNV
jgi:hypothetical protein